MAETIRDLLGAAKERGFTADQTRTRFREKYGQELDDYQDKLDTTLEQVEAFKPAPEPKAVGIAGAPKMEFPAVREFGKELATGKTSKGLAIGEAVGGLLGAPTAGATIGAGIGKLLEPAPEGAPPLGERTKAGVAKVAPYKPRPVPVAEKPAEPEPVGLPEEATKAEEEPTTEDAGWALSPWAMGQRFSEAGIRFSRSALGETKGTQKLEEPAMPDPDKPRPPDVKPPAYRSMFSIEDSPVERLAKQQAWDKMQKDPELAEDVRRDWAATYASREARGAPKTSEKLPERVDWPWLETPRLPGAPGTTLPDPDLPRPEEGSTGEKMYWDLMQKDPKLAEKARQEWAPVYAARAARGQPQVQEGVLPERMRPAKEQVAEEREERRVTGILPAIYQPAYNLGLDVTTSLAGLADMAFRMFGPATVPSTPEVQFAEKKLKEAEASGDKKRIKKEKARLEEAKQRAVGGEVGAGLGMMPGQVAGLLEGLTDPSGANVLLTHPFSVWTTLGDPAIGGYKYLKAADPVKFVKAERGIKAAAGAAFRPVINLLPERLRNAVSRGYNKLVQYMADRLYVGDKEMSAVLDSIVKDPEQMQAAADLLERRIKKGDIKIVEQDLVPVDLTYTPADDVVAARAAVRKAEQTGARAEAMKAVKTKAEESAAKINELRKDIKNLKKQATQIDKQITKATEAGDKLKLKQQQEVLKAARLQQEARLKAELNILKQREKAKVASEEVMERGVGLAEEAKSRTADKAIMKALAEMERRQAAAEEARVRGVQVEDVLRERTEKARADLQARERAAADTAALAGLEMTEAVKGMEGGKEAVEAARKAAAAPSRFVAGAKRSAEAAAKAAESAGERPEVSLGRIYLPREKLGYRVVEGEPTMLRITSPQSTVWLQQTLRYAEEELARAQEAADPVLIKDAQVNVDRIQQALENARRGEFEEDTSGGKFFGDVQPDQYKIIEDLATKASDYKKQAIQAGFNPDAPVKPEVARKIGVPENSTVYTAARRLAEHIDSIKADPGLLTEFLESQGIKRGVPEATRWLKTEIEAQNAAVGMIEPTYGAVRRPTPVREQYEVMRTGRVAPREAAREAAYERLGEPIKEGEELPSTEERNLNRVLDEMSQYSTEREPPKSIKTDNEEFNAFMQRYAKQVRELGSFGEELPEPPMDMETPDAPPPPGEPLVNKWARREIDAGRKILTPERIFQRLTNALLNDTVQLTLHSPEFRTYLMNLVNKRLDETGLNKAEKKQARIEIGKLISDPKRMSTHSKEKFPVVSFQGNPILKVDDFIEAAEKLEPAIVNEARARTIQHTANEMNRSSAALATQHGIASEMNRFRYEPGTNEPRKLPDGTVVSTQGAEGYAIQLAHDVVLNNETLPLIMPYAGKKIGQVLRSILDDNPKMPEQFKPKMDEAQRARLRQLIDHVERFDAAQMENAPDGSIQSRFTNALNNLYAKTFVGTDAKPPEFYNVHMDPAVLRAMESIFQDLGGGPMYDGLTGALVGLSKAAQRNVVPLNLVSLINNNLSNTLFQVVSRGDANFLPRLFTNTYKYGKYMDGETAGLSPAEIRKFEAINRHAPLGHTQYANQLTKSNWWQELKREQGLNTTKMGRILSGPFDGYGKFTEMMTDAYSKYGDVPFRMEEMDFIYDNLSQKINSMEVGGDIEIPISRQREVRVTKLADDKFQIQDVAGRERPITVDATDPRLADVFAANANYMQNKKFLNPKNLGLWGRSLQRGPLSFLSGIFTWYQGAMDIPFIKPGLGQEMMFGGPNYKTTSKAVQAMQANEHMARALKRIIMINSAQTAFLKQRDLRELRQSQGYNPSLEATILADASNPAYMRFRSLDPMMFLTPSINFLNTIVNGFETMRFSPVFNEPDFYAKVALADEDWANYSNEQLAILPPKLAEYGKEMRELSKSDPEAYKNRALIKRDMTRWAKGEIGSADQFLQTLGLAGGPALNWLMKVKEGTMSFDEARRKLAEMTFGVTPVRMADVALAGLGELGVSSAGELSSYGTDLAKSGFHAQSETAPDASTLAEYAMRQIFGVGWKTAFYGTGNEKPDDSRGVPRLLMYLNKMRSDLKKSIGKSARKQAVLALGANATEEQIQRHVENSAYYQAMMAGLEKVYNESRQTLLQQRDALRESREKYPAPVLEPRQ